MKWTFKPLAYALGRAMAIYGLTSIRPFRATIEDAHLLPSGPAIYYGWHGANLLAMGMLRAFEPRLRCSIVPHGLTGTTIRGFLHGIGGVEPITLNETQAGSVRAVLNVLGAALHDGRDVVIAADGPAGPRGQMRPGAAWLARRTGFPLVPIGYHAWPAVRVPRWDRHIVPVPGARVVAVVGSPIQIERRQPVDRLLLDSLADRLNAVTSRAESLEQSRPQMLIGRENQKQGDR